MTKLTVVKRRPMRANPSRDAEIVRRLEVDQQVTTLDVAKQITKHNGVDEEWQKVEFIDADADVRDEGWVLSADVQGGEEIRPEVDAAGFVSEAIRAQRVFNDVKTTAPWLVSANFLIARALIETGLTNAPPKIAGSDAVGPLQVSSAEWQLLLDTKDTYGSFTPIQRDGAIRQIYGAAFLMVHDAKAISEAMRANETPKGTNENPFIPSLLDVFHAYLTGSAVVAAALINAHANDDGKARKIDVFLAGLLTPAQVSALFKAREKYLGTPVAPKTVADVVAATEAELGTALTKAFELMKEHAPEELAQVKQGEASWFDVAEAELAKEVAESNSAKADIILGYFNATDLKPKPTSVKTPWCGAFAAFCMQSSGNPVPPEAALARSWKNWGDALEIGNPDVPRGAVVVLSPDEGTESSGHVGFFDQFVGDHVQLLGGNQSNQLKFSRFPKAKIAALRWIDSGAAAAAEQFDATPSNSAISPAAIKLILEAEVSGPATYERKYRGPIWPGLQSGVTVGIGYDVGQTRAMVVAEDWGGVIDPAMLAALDRAAGVTGVAARALAQQLKGRIDISFDQAKKVHESRVIPRWVAIVEKALGPNISLLGPDCLGALVSLTYNRGASFSATKDRYREMRAIKQCVANRQFGQIPGQIRAMKRLWPTMSGLQTRRESEAGLFERGLAAKPPGQNS